MKNPPLSFGDLFEVSAERSGGHLQYLEGLPPRPSGGAPFSWNRKNLQSLAEDSKI